MWRTRYEAYGNTAAGTVPNGIGFTGHVNDADTGLVYMQQRYYDPIAARFMSLDPVTTDANTGRSFSRYSYVGNNPYGFVDPDGQDQVPIFSELFIGAPTLRATGEAISAALDYSITGGYGAKTRSAWNSGNFGHATVYTLSGAAFGLMNLATLGEAGAVLAGVRAFAAKDLGGVAAKGIANPVPSTMARVIPNGVPATTLGRPGASDVFVTGASDIAGLSSTQIAQRLTIPESPTGFKVIEFSTPRSGVASPVFRSDPGFVGGGRTARGAREFVIPNGPIPANAIIRTMP